MSAYDDFCGCGDYACSECFGGAGAVDDPTGNAWLDEAMVKHHPTSETAERARERLRKYSPQSEVLS